MSTLERRTTELITEVKKMGEDGRCDPKAAMEIMVDYRNAWQKIQKERMRQTPTYNPHYGEDEDEPSL